MGFLQKVTADKVIDIKDKLIWKKAEKIASDGHYLDRAIGLAELFGVSKDYVDLLKAHQKFMKNNYKPHWVNAIMEDVSESIIALAERDYNATKEDLSKIYYGLDSDTAKKEGIKPPKDPSHSARSNM